MKKEQKELRNELFTTLEKLVDVEKKAQREKVEKSAANSGLKEAVEMIMKDAIYSTNTGGQFAQREHLDKQIGDITDRKTPFLDRVKKVKANGKTHEWDMVTALGSNSTVVAECGTPLENDATITRYSAQVKTYATNVKVCDLAQWAASDYFDLMNLHLKKGMTKIMQDVESDIYYGNHSGTETNAISGLYYLISTYGDADQIVAGGGASITQTMVDNAIQSIVDNGGLPTHMFMGAKDLRDFAALWANKVVYNDPKAGMTFGYNVARYMSYAGPIEIVLDPLLLATDSPNTTNSDVFIVDMNQIALAETEPMYKLPTYRALDLAETQTVVWNIALELKVAQWCSIVENLG